MALPERVAYSPGEFAKLFGKSQTWGYREIYRGNVKAITKHGRILIPAKEVERILESAGIYDGTEKPKPAQKKATPLSAEQKSIWQRFVEMRRQKGGAASKAASPMPHRLLKRQGTSDVSSRLKRAWKKDGLPTAT